MQYGITIPPFSDFFDPRTLATVAAEAEQAGWDGFFLWDHVALWPAPIADPWVALTAVALSTSRMRIGAVVTPLPRRRPTKFAREAVSLDHVSDGRLIVGVGSGGGPWEYEYLGDEPNLSVRAAMLDEALELLVKLWTGEPVMHTGRFYRFHGDGGPDHPEHAPTPFLPPPVQRPRIPIWVAGAWPKKAPFRRAARWDGVVPLAEGKGFGEYLTTTEVRDIVAYVQQHRTSDAPFDVVIAGHTTGQNRPADRALVEPYAAAGVTWWLEDISPWPFGWSWQGPWPIDAMRARVHAGPPVP
jgi:alkanesulfonate monooxygenase SsuD/methylene tetrahydromethanopterin reductase-like flavin-dependent oxidoreductase (luciferase family)